MTPELELRLLNDWQRGFPLLERPFAVLADHLHCAEAEVIATLKNMQTRGTVSRVGAVFRPHILGASTLAAVACPGDRLEAVAAMIDSYPEVNHNYQREHVYNLWFVLTAPTRQRIDAVLDEIRRHSGLPLLDLPMLTDYHIDLGFDLTLSPSQSGGGRRMSTPGHRDAAGSPLDAGVLREQMEAADYALCGALENGLLLLPRPYAALAAACNMGESEAIARIGRLIELGVIRRFGVVVRHQELGFTANAMVVWDVPDSLVAAVGRLLGGQPQVSLCYQRPRRLPDWPYNLFTMLHGRDRAEVLATLADLRTRLGLTTLNCQPLFSCRRFKQRGAHYSSPVAEAA